MLAVDWNWVLKSSGEDALAADFVTASWTDGGIHQILSLFPGSNYASFFSFWGSGARSRSLQGLGGWKLEDLDGLGPED